MVFGSLILDLLGFTVVLPLFPALLDYYSKHDSSGLYSSLLSSVTYYQHIIGIPARFQSVLFGGMWVCCVLYWFIYFQFVFIIIFFKIFYSYYLFIQFCMFVCLFVGCTMYFLRFVLRLLTPTVQI